jgi:hypothetical protein
LIFDIQRVLFDFSAYLSSASSKPGIKQVTQRIAQHIETKDCNTDSQAWEDGQARLL